MKHTGNGKKQKRREALKKWLKDRLGGGWQPQQKQSPTSSQSKFVA